MHLFLRSKESKDSSKYTVQIHYKHQRKGRKSRKNTASMHLFSIILKSKESKDISEYTIHLHYKYQRKGRKSRKMQENHEDTWKDADVASFLYSK